nr:hypothetical protein [Aureimonas sp. D3]
MKADFAGQWLRHQIANAQRFEMEGVERKQVLLRRLRGEPHRNSTIGIAVLNDSLTFGVSGQ